MDRANGTEQWTQKALARRQLTAPVIYRGRVVVADAGGILHWLDAATGDFIARAEVGKSVGRNSVIVSKGIALKKRVSGTPLVAGGLLLAFTDDGQLSAYSARCRRPARHLRRRHRPPWHRRRRASRSRPVGG